MWIILDLIIGAVFFICIIAGGKKGFIKSCLGLIVTLLAIAITLNTYRPVGKFFRETVVYENLKNGLKETIENHIGKTNDADTVLRLFNDATEQLPEFNSMLESFNFNGEKAAAEVDNILNEGKEFTVDLVCERIVEEAAVFISDAVAVIAVFLGSVLVLNLLIYILDLIFKLPVLNFANKTLGLLVGAVKGLLFAFVITSALRMALPYLDGTGIKLTESDIENTVLFSAVESINPIRLD